MQDFTITVEIKSPVSLCAEAHRNYGYLTLTDQDLKTKSLFTPIALFEFADVAQHYPIMFCNNDARTPVAVTGLTKNVAGRNSSATYETVTTRLYPFALEKLPNQDAGIVVFDAHSKQVVSLDEDSRAQPFFTKSGEPSQELRNLAGYLERLYYGRRNAEVFSKALEEAGLLVPQELAIQSKNEDEQAQYKFYVINQKAYRDLQEKTVHHWFKNGWLDAAQMVLLSQQHWMLPNKSFMDKVS